MHPFDDFRALLEILPDRDNFVKSLIIKRVRDHFGPKASLGKLQDLLIFYMSWRGCEDAKLQKPLIAFFAGNHGLMEQYPGHDKDWTEKKVTNFAKNQALINHFCKKESILLKIFDLALAYPTMNIKADAALDSRAAAATMAYGMEAIIGDIDLLVLNAFGQGLKFSNAAVIAALFDEKIEFLLDFDQDLAKKQYDLAWLKTSLLFHKDAFQDPLEIMRCLGGREIAALIGAILAARMENIPVILDDDTALVAGAILYKLNPKALDHCFLSDKNQSKLYAYLVKRLGKDTFFDLGLTIGQSLNAAFMVSLLRQGLDLMDNLQNMPEFMPEI